MPQQPVQPAPLHQDSLTQLKQLSVMTQFYPPDFAPTGQLIEELVAYLEQQGIHIDIFTGQPGYAANQQTAPAKEQLGNLFIRRSRTSSLWPHRIRGKAISGLLFAIRSALHLLKPSARQGTLLLTTAPPYLAVAGFLANLVFGTPYVCLVYDVYPDVAVGLGVIPEQHHLVRLWRRFNQWVWQRAQSIIVLSSTMKDRVLACCPEVADKTFVIHSWADPNLIQPIPKQDNWFAKKYQLVEPFTVLYSGNMGRCHDMDTILEAAQQLQGEPVQFVFVGGGPKLPICQAKVKALGLTNCLFLPYQEKRHLAYSLSAGDLALVSIAPGMEGLVAPSKLYGTLAAGFSIAAICQQKSYLRQILADAKCGEAFLNGDSTSLANHIRYLAEHRHLATQMGESGRRYFESHFTLKTIAQQYLRALSSMSESYSAKFEIPATASADKLI